MGRKRKRATKANGGEVVSLQQASFFHGGMGGGGGGGIGGFCVVDDRALHLHDGKEGGCAHEQEPAFLGPYSKYLLSW